jgi:hypothetical protein
VAERRAHLVVVLLAGALPLVAQSPAAAIVAAFAPHDVDGDGCAEVRQLSVLDEKGAPGAPLVLVLVEARLQPPATLVPTKLAEPLATFAADLAHDGFHALVVIAEVHSGPPHQDGRTVLGLRRLLQRVRARAPLAGAVLIGHFPDALLVRTCNWRRNEQLSLPGKDGKPIAFEPATTNVRCVPEIVAHRCDLVLADLDGDWEKVYVPGPTKLPSVTVVYGERVPDAGGKAVAMQAGELEVVDVFHVRDGAAVADGEAFAVRLDPADRDHECSAVDRARGNPMALPDIAISRIDARGVAWRLPEEAFEPEPIDVDVQASHRVKMRPKVLAGADGKPPSQPAWLFDQNTEMRLLVEYLARNHAFRTTPLPATHRRPAAIGHGLGTGMDALRAADAAWVPFAEPGYDVPEANLLQVHRWLQQPAVLRTLRAHSDPWGAVFAATDPDALTKELGVPCHWIADGDRLAPSWRDHRGGRADFTFYRSIWAGKRASAAANPYLLIHTGCEALSPPHSNRPYDDPSYGQRAHAESILFFTECLAIVGRAKVFYDEPREFAATLGAGKTFGEAWQRYFELESQHADWNEVGGDIGRKRAYFWSIVGDWTLRLPKAP